MQRPISRIKVKVCGMTQASQVVELVELAVDAVGVILDADSPRLITVEQAKDIRRQIPAFMSMVGVFVDSEVGHVNAVSKEIGLDLVQLHGAESRQYTRQLSVPYIKAIRAKSADQVVNDIQQFPEARALLLDPYVKGQHGGTGQQLEPSVWPSNSDAELTKQKLILAGGLSDDNLLCAVQNYQPYAVDLNSGVEVSPGQKDINLVAACLAILGR